MEITLDKKLQGFRQIAQEKLQSILCSIPDSQKDLVIETCLIKPLEHVCGASWLRLVNIFGFHLFCCCYFWWFRLRFELFEPNLPGIFNIFSYMILLILQFPYPLILILLKSLFFSN